MRTLRFEYSTIDYEGKGFEGVQTSEQRPSVDPLADSTQQSGCFTEKGGTSMKEKNNTEAPRLKINWSHIFLVGLHLVVFVFSVVREDFITTRETTRALPQALCG